MYPSLYYLLKDLLGVEFNFLKTIYSFGLFEALGFCAAAWVLTIELKRKEQKGDFFDVATGRKLNILPSNTVPFVTILAAITGIGGAKLFGVFDNLSGFLKHPIKTFFSGNGFVFFGGLITATVALWAYYHFKKINPLKVADAVALCLMPAYAIGRIGCHIAGDGDWGIANLSPKPFNFLPDWLWAYHYPHNISRIGFVIPQCDWDPYCYQLPIPVYPTPLYETIVVFFLFFILWMLRKRITYTGRITAIYLMMISTERFFIEMIRINPVHNIWGILLTQAQIISIILFTLGCFIFFKAPYLVINKNKSYK
jgi:phosphatidylglycerol:prolipoprotein diacylglycerol transferase